jgi:hypothetical protein
MLARRWRLAATLAAALAVLVVSIKAYKVAVVEPVVAGVENVTCTDFDTFFFGAKLVRRGLSYYDRPTLLALAQREANHVKVPAVTTPVFATIPFMPLIDLPYAAARIIWHMFTLVALIAAFVLIRTGAVRVAGGRLGARAEKLALAGYALVVVAYVGGVRYHFCQGQTNIQMLTLLALAIPLAASPGCWRDAAPGFVLALAVMSKVFPAIVLPAFLCIGRWRVVAWTAAGCVALALATAPLASLWDYVRFPSHFSGTYYFSGGSDVPHNIAFKRLWMMLFADPQKGGAWLGPILSAVCAMPVAWVFGRLWWERRRAPGGVDLHFLCRYWQLCLMIGFIMSSYWEYHLVLGFGGAGLIVMLFVQDWRAWHGPFAAVVVATIGQIIPASMLLAWFAGSLALVRCASILTLVVALEWVARKLAPPGLTSHVLGAEPML